MGQHYTTCIIISLASHILLNTITRPVKISSVVCLHAKNRDFQSAPQFDILHFLRSVAMFKRKTEESTVTKLVVNCLEKLLVLIISTQFLLNKITQSKTSARFCAS